MDASSKNHIGKPGLHVFVFLVIAVIYAFLLADVPVDDEAAFVARALNRRGSFDFAYPLLLPTLSLFVDAFGDFLAPVLIFKLLNLCSAAAGLAIFSLTLEKIGASNLLTWFVVFFVAVTFNYLSLAPTGHPKFLAYPFLSAALHCSVLWEMERDRVESRRLLILSGIFLGLSALFLINSLLVVPFGVLAIFFRRFVDGRARLLGGLGEVVVFGGFVASVFFAGVLFVIVQQGVNVNDVFGIILQKKSSGGTSENLVVMFSRAVFALVFGFAGLQGVGSSMRAALAGLVPEPSRVFIQLAPSLFALLLVGLCLGYTYARAVFLLFSCRSQRPLAFPLAFVLGFFLFGVYWQLNEAEFWYQVIAPTCLIFLLIGAPGYLRGLVAFGCVVVGFYNLSFFSLPRLEYPLIEYKKSVANRFQDNDLVLYFSAYPGRPTFAFLAGDVKARLSVDALYFEYRSMTKFQGALSHKIQKALSLGGHVYAFEVFDEGNWDAPWLQLASKGFDRAGFYSALSAAYCIQRLDDEYRLKMWEIKSDPDCR